MQIGSRWVAIGIAALAGAAGAQGSKTPGSVPLQITSKDQSVTFRDGIFHCAAPGHPDAKLYSSCLALPVIVLAKRDGGCLAVIPYLQLTVHSKRERTRLDWRILGLKTATFETTKGIDIEPTAIGSGQARSKVYEGNSGAGAKFEWFVKVDAIPGESFYHAPVVLDGGKPCEPIDPVIINVEN